MTSRDAQIRAAITDQASDWFVQNDAAPLDAGQSAAFVTWLQASPLHVEEFLGVATLGRNLRGLGRSGEFSLDDLLARAGSAEEGAGRFAWLSLPAGDGNRGTRRWQTAAMTALAIVLAIVGLRQWFRLSAVQPELAAGAPPALQFRTQHGEQRTIRLPDNSVLHLNTDSAATVRYDAAQRLVILDSGEAALEVTHEPQRSFKVRAGLAEVTDLGTRFDVRLNADSTLVTVTDGRVAVARAGAPEQPPASGAARTSAEAPVVIVANQQVRVEAEHWPPTPEAVNAEHTTAWLHRQISFDHEPLGLVAAEFNRYAAKPIEITSPALRDLQVSGVFSTDDPEEFLAFLRSLQGVRVEVTASQIRVSAK
jgi:transmembrane sensor